MNPWVQELLDDADPAVWVLFGSLVVLAFLVGVFAAIVEWVWGLWKGRKEE